MSTVAKKTKKKMGRPPLGVDTLVAVRMSPSMLNDIQAWATSKNVGKSEAVRQLVALGLKRK